MANHHSSFLGHLCREGRSWIDLDGSEHAVQVHPALSRSSPSLTPSCAALHVAKDRYNVSKLLDVFLAHQIAALPLASGVVVNVINPGLCVSELRREMGGVIACVAQLAVQPKPD